MHQHPRSAPRSTPSANPPLPNSTRSNNAREETSSRTSSRQGRALEAGQASPGTLSETTRSEGGSAGQSSEASKLNLIVQHFFSKAALIIVSSRIILPPSQSRDGEVRLDKWFNTWVEDTNALSEDLQQWKAMDVAQKRPPPLVVEVYLDMAQSTQNQSLVAIDDDNKRWDVSEALRKNANFAQTPSEIVYERWTLSLDDPSSVPASQLNETPPNVYKKGVVLLRSLFTYARFLPAWKLARRITRQTANGSTPKSKFRILKRDVTAPRLDSLTCPLYPSSGPVTEDYHFAPLPCAFGSMRISVTYRNNCNFEIDTAERLLSARFGGGPLDSSSENAARPADSVSMESQRSSSYRPWGRMPSTGDSRADEFSPRGASGYRANAASKSSLKSEAISASLPRRTSVSFQPFKAGSLSSSPASGLHIPSSPSSSLGRASNASLTPHIRQRTPLTTPQQALRTPSLGTEHALSSSTSSSPKPAPIQRYSSSFSNRRARFPSNAGSRVEEDNSSSDRGSISSTHRNSSVLNEPEGSGSVPAQDDAESIGDFLKMLDTSAKGMSSFNKTDKASLDANSQRTAAQYSRFARMRDSATHLSDSMSSSLMLQRSSSSSSRQLSNVPGLGGASLSSSSSPGKAVSPHTPHMPAVPSRLSNNSIANYSHDDPRHRPRSSRSGTDSAEGASEASTARERGTTAIDIPNSPRTFPVSRRSSSVHHQGRLQGHVDDDPLPFGLRSASLPNEERLGHTAADDDEPLLFAMGELGSQRRTE